MKNIYFVKYSFEDEKQPLKRKHSNCTVEIEVGVLNVWEFTDKLCTQEGAWSCIDLTIDFMIKIGETS